MELCLKFPRTFCFWKTRLKIRRECAERRPRINFRRMAEKSPWRSLRVSLERKILPPSLRSKPWRSRRKSLQTKNQQACLWWKIEKRERKSASSQHVLEWIFEKCLLEKVFVRKVFGKFGTLRRARCWWNFDNLFSDLATDRAADFMI